MAGMSALGPALVTAGAGIVGDLLSSSGQSAANAENLQIAQMQDTFSAQQAQLNRQFQQQQTDTAMQTRVADLDAAGLNPALAYQLGGAQAMPGSTASASGNPQMQNTGAAFAQLGNQTGNAMQLQQQQSQIDLNKAQANKITAETDQVIPANVQNIQAQTNLTSTQAQAVARNVKMLDIQLSPINVGDGSMFASNYVNQTMQNELKTNLGLMDQQERQDTLTTLIKARNDINFAESIGAENIAKASNTSFGQIMSYFQLFKPFVSTAQGAAGAASDVAGMLP